MKRTTIGSLLVLVCASCFALAGCMLAPSSGERQAETTVKAQQLAAQAVAALDAAAAEVDRIQADVEQARATLAVAQEADLDTGPAQEFLAQRERELATAQSYLRLARIVAHIFIPPTTSPSPATAPSPPVQ